MLWVVSSSLPWISSSREAVFTHRDAWPPPPPQISNHGSRPSFTRKRGSSWIQLFTKTSNHIWPWEKSDHESRFSSTFNVVCISMVLWPNRRLLRKKFNVFSYTAKNIRKYASAINGYTDDIYRDITSFFFFIKTADADDKLDGNKTRLAYACKPNVFLETLHRPLVWFSHVAQNLTAGRLKLISFPYHYKRTRNNTDV